MYPLSLFHSNLTQLGDFSLGMSASSHVHSKLILYFLSSLARSIELQSELVGFQVPEFQGCEYRDNVRTIVSVGNYLNAILAVM